MMVKLQNVTEGAAMEFTLPDGATLLLNDGVAAPVSEDTAAWLLEVYPEYVVTTTLAADEPQPKE